MSKFKSQEEAEAAGVYIRKVQSFVKREGRLTSGQALAIEKFWGKFGLDFQTEAYDLAKEFGRDAPVVLEIGFGMGKSLVEMAASEPDKNFIGIEVHTPGVGACLCDMDEQNLTNIRLFGHDAVEILKQCIADNSLSRMQLYFPDPWHKKRHHKRRILQPDFAQLVRSKLKTGGIFHMATDWENYAEHMLNVMSVQEGYKNTSENTIDSDKKAVSSEEKGFVPRPDFRPLTKFEQRGHRLGHGVWDLIFEKIS